jgi:hypothetical protein
VVPWFAAILVSSIAPCELAGETDISEIEVEIKLNTNNLCILKTLIITPWLNGNWLWSPQFPLRLLWAKGQVYAILSMGLSFEGLSFVKFSAHGFPWGT